MWEKFKTLVLSLLIISSLLLTYQLWYGSPEYEAMTPPLYERISFGEAPPSDEFLLPEKILYVNPLEGGEDKEEGEEGEIREGEEEEEASQVIESFDTYILTPRDTYFTSLWEEFYGEFKNTSSRNLTYWREDSKNLSDLYEVNNPSLVLYFNLPFSYQVFYSPEDSFSAPPPLEKIHLFLEEEGLRGFMETPQGDYYRLEWDINPNQFLSLGEEIQANLEPNGLLLEEVLDKGERLRENLVAPRVFVPRYAPQVPDLSCDREEMDVDQLARAFFVDYSVVRQVKQRDEGVFYTDGNKGLRIDSQGIIEYSAPISRQEVEPLSLGEAFHRGLEYVTVYGGWPQELDLRVSQLEEITLEEEEFFRLTFAGYYQEIPLARNYLNLELIYNHQGLVSFHRQLCQVETGGEGEKVLELKEALEKMLDSYPELFARESPRQITRCYLAYAPEGEDYYSSPLKPYWVVEIGGRQKVLIDARQGEAGEDIIYLN